MKHNRKIMTLSGKDRVSFLNDLLTIPIELGMSLRYGALLTPQGKILCDLFIMDEGDHFLLDLPADDYDNIKARLSMYKLRADVTILDDDRAAYQAIGEGDPRGPIGMRRYEPPINPMDIQTYCRLRIEGLIPEFGIDFHAGEAYPVEWRFAQMGGIDFRKGCFVGQEIAARMRHKTELQKTIIPLLIQGDPKELTIGQAITADGREIGKLLSICQDKAMGFVRLKWLQTSLSVGGVAVKAMSEKSDIKSSEI